MSGTRANTIADRNPHSMHAPDSRVNPPTCTKFADEPQFVALQVYHRHQYTNEKREALALWGKEVMQIVAKYPAEAKSG